MNNNNTNHAWWRPGLVMFAKVSTSIAIPIIIAFFLGRYLDTKYNSTPWVFLGLTGFAFIISIFSIWRNLTVYMHNLEKEEKTKNPPQPSLNRAGEDANNSSLDKGRLGGV